MPLLPVSVTGTQELSAEEFANCATHGLAFLMTLIAVPAVLNVALHSGDPWKLTGCSIYGLTLAALFAASTLSHLFHQPPLRKLFRSLDQAMIFLMMAGTYTPFSLVYLRDAWGWLLFLSVWLVALSGFLSKAVYFHRIEGVSTWLYLVQGGLPLLAMLPVMHRFPADLWLLVLSAKCFYLVGLVFWYRSESWPFAHAVWHILVMLGASFQYTAIFYYTAK